MVNKMSRVFLGFIVLLIIFSVGVKAGFAQPTPTPDALAKTLASSIDAKNKNSVQALIHPQLVSYLRVTDPAMLNNITASLMALKIPPDYKMGVISLDDLEKSSSGMASYDKTTQTLTMMGSPAYYKIPPSHLMALAVEKEKTVEVDGKKETKLVKIPLTPTPLPIGQYQGNWYIVFAAGEK